MKHAPLALSIVALVLAGVALWKTPGPLLASGTGLDAYDFSTPEAAFRSGLEMQANKDIGAMLSFGRLLQQERYRTAKVADSALHGDQVILFVSFEEDGKAVYKTQGTKRLQGTDIWVKDYISHYDVKKDDPKLAERMEEWRDRTDEDSDK
ncbi:MAG: hypothetical protein GY946_29990 [bacterium]|nr:hypothetical protein [bacterium]